VAARTVNPPGNETAAAQVTAGFLESHGIPYRIHESAPGRANIIGRIGSGEPVLLVACHLDTVPVGEGWTSDPFALRVEGDRAYGRGVSDNKGPLAAALIAARRLTEAGPPARGTLLVAGLADEERGNECGAEFLLREGLLQADYVIAPDSAGHMEEIGIAEKGVVFLKVGCRGRSAHASRPADGVNAIAAMAMLINDLAARPVPSVPHDGFSPATMNVGKVQGGIAGNVVPDLCEAEVDFRILPGTNPGDVGAFIDAGIARVLSTYPEARFEVEQALSMPPHEVGLDNFLVEACQRASERVYGRRMRPFYQGGVTIAKEFALSGTPSVSLGPGSPEAAHQVDEWLEIDEALSFADFLVEVARTTLK
jgi:acetylornithine deacetylase/succinyl-diaminopimelate desuccinylase family protein